MNGMNYLSFTASNIAARRTFIFYRELHPVHIKKTYHTEDKSFLFFSIIFSHTNGKWLEHKFPWLGTYLLIPTAH